MDFETIRKMVAPYKTKGELDRESALKVKEYCEKTKCENCELARAYKRCPIVVALDMR